MSSKLWNIACKQHAAHPLPTVNFCVTFLPVIRTRTTSFAMQPSLSTRNKFEMVNKGLIAKIELPGRVNKPLPVS